MFLKMKPTIFRIKSVFSFLVIVITVACSNIVQPELKGIQVVNVQQFGLQEIKIDALVIVHNPNSKAIRINSAEFDVLLKDDIIGRLILNQPVEINANSDNSCPCTLTINSKVGMKLGFKTLKKITGGELKIRLKGSINGRFGILRKKILVDKEL
jgi:LEA14-like dessication related protein